MSMSRNFATFSNLLFAASILLGIFLPQAAFITFFLILPAMMVILMVTLLRFPPGFFRKPRALLPGALLGSFMNYLIFGNLIILESLFLIRNENMWIGMILIAAVPAAVAIVPMTDKLRGQLPSALSGFAGTYVAALILIPVIGAAFLKYIPMSYDKLIVLFLSLVGLPLIASRIAVDKSFAPFIKNHEGIITDVCFFIIFYTLTAKNAPKIRQWPLEILLISVIAVSSIIIISIILWLIYKFYRLPRQKFIPLLLLGTMKNYGLAGSIALYVFSADAALPALIFSIFMFIFGNVLKFFTPYTTEETIPTPENQN